MPITFDTLDELQAFYRVFKLDEKTAQPLHTVSAPVKAQPVSDAPAPRRGRPPAAQRPMPVAPAKRGPKPKMDSVVKMAAPKRDKGSTLTAKIQNSIQKFLDANQSFTANDVYADLAKRDSDINKQSVITSVLKQMNSTFSHVEVTERPGNGPRPVKLYNPS